MEDINFLAGSTLTRRYGTHGELVASEYIRNRLLEIGLPVNIEPFNCSRDSYQIFSLYWIEFIFVFLLSFFIPVAGFIYGFCIIILYFLEITGYFSLSRFLPEFQSQNIHAVISNASENEKPANRIIFYANYDCGISHFLYSSAILPFLPYIHYLIVISMFIIVGTSFMDSFPDIYLINESAILTLKVIAVIFLASMGLIAFVSASNHEDTRGANFNASGVAGVLAIAEYFANHKLDNTELHFLFTGAHQCWMSGLRYFLKNNPFPKTNTLFVNLEGVGSGTLSIPTKENTVFSFSIDKQLKEIIEKIGTQYGIKIINHLPVPTASFSVLARGYKGFTVIGLDEEEKPAYFNQLNDTTLNIDEKQVNKSVELICSIVNGWLEDKRF